MGRLDGGGARQTLRRFANVFLIGFSIDGVLSAADDLLRIALGLELLSIPRQALAFAVLVASLPMYVLLGITPRLSWRIFLPPCLYLAWLSMGAMPLPLLLGRQGALLAASILQIGFAAVALLLARRATYGQSFLLTAESFAGPGFRGRTAIGFSALNLFVILPVSVSYILVSLAMGLEYGTRGFMRVGLSGVYTSERTYARDDQTIHLIATMHIAESRFYEDLIASFPVERSIIAAEGVSDERDLLPGFSYGKIASRLGLAAQGPLATAKHETLRADVDVSEFAPGTIRLLRGVAELMNADSALEALLAYGRLVDMEPDLEMLQQLQHDLLQLRNDHLFVELTALLKEYDRLIVPWGGLHMPDLERRVLELGFEPTETHEWEIVGW